MKLLTPLTLVVLVQLSFFQQHVQGHLVKTEQDQQDTTAHKRLLRGSDVDNFPLSDHKDSWVPSSPESLKNGDNEDSNTQIVKHHHVPPPKMNGKPITIGDENSLFDKTPNDDSNNQVVETVSSRVAYFLGECSSETPFQFSIGGESGRGVIGTPSAPTDEESHKERSFVTSISFADPDEEGEITAWKDRVEPNFFATSTAPSFGKGGDTSTSFVGIPFQYDEMKSHSLSAIRVFCSSADPIDIIVVVRDNGREVVDAIVSHDISAESDNLRVALVERESTVSLWTKPVVSMAQRSHNPNRERHLKMVQASSRDILLQKRTRRIQEPTKKDSKDSDASTIADDGGGCTLVQMTIQDSEGMDVPKTLVVCGQHHDYDGRNRKLKEQGILVKLKGADIDTNGDVIFSFERLQQNDAEFEESTAVIKLDARIGIASECNDEQEIIGVVDMSAMLSPNDPTLIVNGGWFRRARNMHKIKCNWEPVVIDAIITDPAANYSQLGRLDSPIKAMVMQGDNINFNERRNLLKASPSADELSINEEMMRGRKPDIMTSNNSSRGLEKEDLLQKRHGQHRSRALVQQAKKILVHGYCDTGSPFPTSHFTNAIEFADPDTVNPRPSSWGLDEFARKIDKFAYDNDISSCGIIAHSQGGLASLHLYNTYWSCLDNSSNGGDRKIQSVGSPYKGTVLAGTLAALGEVFDQSCGYNYELTEYGATSWLNGVYSWARKEVHYYTTSNYDSWWGYEYCNFASDLILSDPDDGVIEKGRGRLSGGQNKGHTTGQCHSVNMSDKAQYYDKSRNTVMNSKAKY